MAGNGYGLAPLSSIENFIIYFCIILKILFIIIYITKFISFYTKTLNNPNLPLKKHNLGMSNNPGAM
jgi:hypothetical protein